MREKGCREHRKGLFREEKSIIKEGKGRGEIKRINVKETEFWQKK